ncbi:winged helix-turn-helix domain-containing protein [Hyphococcus luteus]|uniref:OmpR/PhoB-type domain-containing protein n=1 Tax=Hyphococcus luteus TaxID=2058213 RepID=A0A2S7K2I2_9PROT|nr:winged helix-turn-helix domain-containing protein [Marinicaulis flavus]PQA86709.1 hypothetical protein CW354_14550 [Marinicaulis flavus]
MSVADLSTAPEAAKEATPSFNENAMRIEGAIYYPGARRLEAGGATQVLEPRLGDLLMRLAEADGPVARGVLLDDVWGDEGSDEALTQAVSKLRRILGDEQRPYRVIRTIPKFGYQLEAAPAQMAASKIARPSLMDAVTAHFGARKEFYKGLACGVGLMIAIIVAFGLLTPPRTIEREMILCPPGAPENECMASLDRS